MDLPDDLVALLRAPTPCFLATLMPDGSPQLTQTWVDTDGRHVLVNSRANSQKVRNLRRDPRVALNVLAPPVYHQVRGRVVDITTDGAADHVEALSQRYNGVPYPWYGGRDQERVIMTIAAERITEPRRRR
jgi:PPOX class probable F420-dependent enzyme